MPFLTVVSPGHAGNCQWFHEDATLADVLYYGALPREYDWLPSLPPTRSLDDFFWSWEDPTPGAPLKMLCRDAALTVHDMNRRVSEVRGHMLSFFSQAHRTTVTVNGMLADIPDCEDGCAAMDMDEYYSCISYPKAHHVLAALAGATLQSVTYNSERCETGLHFEILSRL